MFELRSAPVYLAPGALALAGWAALAPATAQPLALGWALAGMVALYAVCVAIDRAARPALVAAPTREDAEYINARAAARRAASSEDSVDPRR